MVVLRHGQSSGTHDERDGTMITRGVDVYDGDGNLIDKSDYQSNVSDWTRRTCERFFSGDDWYSRIPANAKEVMAAGKAVNQTPDVTFGQLLKATIDPATLRGQALEDFNLTMWYQVAIMLYWRDPLLTAQFKY